MGNNKYVRIDDERFEVVGHSVKKKGKYLYCTLIYKEPLLQQDQVTDLVKNYPEYDGAVVKSAQLTEATQERKESNG